MYLFSKNTCTHVLVIALVQEILPRLRIPIPAMDQHQLQKEYQSILAREVWIADQIQIVNPEI